MARRRFAVWPGGDVAPDIVVHDTWCVRRRGRNVRASSSLMSNATIGVRRL